MADFADVIGPETQVTGRIEGSAPLLVRGRVEGTIALSAALVVAAEGAIQATVEATEVTVEGSADGTIEASERTIVRDGARVSAEVRTPALVIEDGAHFVGRVEMDVPLPEGVSAPGSR